MPLNSQCEIYSVGTDALYDDSERYIHNRMLKLYKLVANKNTPEWKKRSAKRVLGKEKVKLTTELDSKIDSGLVRTLNSKYIFQKNIISLFESNLTRTCDMKPNELSEKLIQIEFYFYQVMKDLIDNGFNFNGKHYVYFSSSAGSIRKHRGLFIEEELYDRIRLKLTCGLTLEKINEKGGCVINKWLAYLALSSSATEVWTDFDIDKAIVCDDFEIDVYGDMDYINSADYSITRKYTSVGIPMNDGVGMMMSGRTRVARGPFIKGLLVQFDFQKFVKEKCTPEQYIVKDIYGTPHNIIEEDIQYIFTKSQLKMWKYYDSWEQYKEYFKKYGCEMCWCNMEQPYVSKARINYQMLNSLHDMTDEEIDKLIEPTAEEIDKIGEDYQTMLRLLGSAETNQNQSWEQIAIPKYPSMMNEKRHRQTLIDTKKSLIKQAKGGRLRVKGYYRLASPDLYAYCERLFLGIENPQGLLKNGEISIKQFKDGEEVDCLRSPHLYFEHCLRVNNRSEEIKKWFTTECIYTSCNDLISRVLALDWDGDILLVTNDKTIKKVVKRNQHDYVPLLFDMRKAAPVEVNSKNIYDGLIAAFKYGKIGIYSNSCAKIWGKEEISQDSLDALKLLVAESNWSIDAAKCLYMPERPESANELIKKETKGKLPYYFVWAKDKRDEPKTKKEVEANLKAQVEKINKSTMNRICASIKTPRIKFNKNLGKFNPDMFLGKNPQRWDLSSDSQIIKSYDYWNRHQNTFNESDAHVKDQDLYRYKQIRKNILEENNNDLECVVNTLVLLLYKMRPSASLRTLWACFGEELNNNLDYNLSVYQPGTKICPICGKRFTPSKFNQASQITCSKECKQEYDIINRREKCCGAFDV